MKASRQSRRLHLVAALVVATVLCPVSSPARAADDAPTQSADPGVEASERFRRGVKLYKDGDFVAALVEFKRAYELEPNYRVLYNLGQTSSQLNDYAAALRAFERYLEEGGQEIVWARKKEVETAIEDLKKKVGRLTITTNVEGAEIQIDDVAVGVSPLDAPVVVNVGRRRVVATRTGHAPARRVIEVAGTDELDVELELVDLEEEESGTPVPPPAPVPAAPAPAESSLPIPGIVGLAVTGASAIVTGVLGGLALSSRGDLDDALAAYPGNGAQIADAQSSTSGLATATDVMIGVTAACAVATVVLFIVDPGGSDAPPETGALSIELAPAPAGFHLQGAF